MHNGPQRNGFQNSYAINGKLIRPLLNNLNFTRYVKSDIDSFSFYSIMELYRPFFKFVYIYNSINFSKCKMSVRIGVE